MLVSGYFSLRLKLPFDRRWVTAQAAMANDTIGAFGAVLENVTLQTPDEAAKALVDLIDGATRKEEGGEFVDVDGSRIPWGWDANGVIFT